MIRKHFGSCILVLLLCVPFFLGSVELNRQACKGLQNTKCANDTVQCGIGEHIDIKYTFYVFVNTYSACSTINCSIQEWHGCGSDPSICRIEFNAADRLKLDDQCNGKMNCDLLSPVLNSTYCNKTTNRTVCFNGFSYQQKGYFIIYDCEPVSSTISSKQPNVKSTTPVVNNVSLLTTDHLYNILTTSTGPQVTSTGQSDNEASKPRRETSDTSVIIGSVIGCILLLVFVIIIVIVVIRRRKSSVARTAGVSNPGYETPTLRINIRENSQSTTDEYNHLHGAQDNNSHNVNDNYNHLMSNADDIRIRPTGDYTHLYDNNENAGGIRQGVTIVNDTFDISDNHTDQQ